MKNLNHGQSWPVVKIKKLDRKLCQINKDPGINNALNIILIVACLVLIGVELWNAI